jgi:hypothetical protein
LSLPVVAVRRALQVVALVDIEILFLVKHLDLIHLLNLHLALQKDRPIQ